MEQVFADLQKEHKNDVDSLMKWIKDAKLSESTQAGEEKLRSLFSGADQKNVELTKFKEVVGKIASEQKKSADEVSKMLADEGSKFMQAAMAGVSALTDKFKIHSRKYNHVREQLFAEMDSLFECKKDDQLAKSTQTGEDNLCSSFSGADQKNVEPSTFKEVMGNKATKQKKSANKVSRLAEERSKLSPWQVAMAEITALADTFY